MSEIEEIVNQVPMDQVAQALGVSQDEAEQATRTAIPALLGGMQANAQDPAGAASLAQALGQHDESALGADVAQIDTGDGQRIVQNVFGDQTGDVMARLGGATPGAGSSLIQRLLPILAPIVMAYLAKKLQGAGGTTAGAAEDSGGLGGMLGGTGGGGLGDVLGGVLGGAMGGQAGATSQGGLQDILGQVLGGAGGAQTQPGTPTGQGGMGDLLGGVLGGLLGGGKR